MKIEIEWTASYKGTIKIQEHSYTVSLLPEPAIKPIGDAPSLGHHYSFASVLMLNLSPVIMGAMQAEAITDDYLDPSGETDNTFRTVPDYIARETHRKIKFYTNQG